MYCHYLAMKTQNRRKTFCNSWQDYSIPREKFMFRNQQGIENDSIQLKNNATVFYGTTET
jgi:hypothetical protein